MTDIAKEKVHFAPYVRHLAAVRELILARRFRNMTHFMRCAVDHYLGHLGRPSLDAQVQQMADDFRSLRVDPRDDASGLQDPSREAESW